MTYTTQSVAAVDGVRLHIHRWTPESTPRFIVMIVHGVGEHAGRYAHVAEYFNGLGAVVIAPDHRNHGLSEGERMHVKHLPDAVRDMNLPFDAIRADYPGLPAYIFAHSMGSLLGLMFAVEHQDKLAGFISSGTPLAGAEYPAWQGIAVRALRRIAPRVPVSGLDPEMIAHGAPGAKDPLNANKPLSAHMAVEIVSSIETLLPKLSTFRLPILILHGGADVICPPRGSQTLYDKVASTDKSLTFYPGLYHEIVNEPEKQQVLDDMGAWLNARV